MPPLAYGVRTLQISGVALITLSILNTLFLWKIHLAVNLMLMLSGLSLLTLSFTMWNWYAKQMQLRRQVLRHG